MFESRVETDRVVRTGVHAQVAEHTGSQVVFVFDQTTPGLARLFVRDGFGGDLYRTVRTGCLAESAGDALVFALGVVGHRERSAEAFVHFERRPVFGILLRDFRGDELFARYLEAREQGADAVKESLDIICHT